MRFNNGLERKRFENNWEKLHIEYRQAGMDEEAIEAMYEFDLEQYRGQRNYCFHNQYMSTDSDQSDYERDDDRSPLVKKFQDRFTTEIGDADEREIYSWIDEIKDEHLWGAVRRLNKTNLEIITLYAIYGYKQKDIAIIVGIKENAVKQRISYIRKHIFGTL